MNSAFTGRNLPTSLLIPVSLLLVTLIPLSSLVMWSGAAVCSGRGKAAQERCCIHTRLRPRRIVQACPMPSFHWLLLVCAGGHWTAYTWDFHQVGETSPIQMSCYLVISGLICGAFAPNYKDSWNLLLSSLWHTNWLLNKAGKWSLAPQHSREAS